jgi:hypothetical protein
LAHPGAPDGIEGQAGPADRAVLDPAAMWYRSNSRIISAYIRAVTPWVTAGVLKYTSWVTGTIIRRPEAMILTRSSSLSGGQELSARTEASKLAAVP